MLFTICKTEQFRTNVGYIKRQKKPSDLSFFLHIYLFLQSVLFFSVLARTMICLQRKDKYSELKIRWLILTLAVIRWLILTLAVPVCFDLNLNDSYLYFCCNLLLVVYLHYYFYWFLSIHFVNVYLYIYMYL